MKRYNPLEHIDEIGTNIISNIIWYIITFGVTNICLWIPFVKGIYETIRYNCYKIPIYAYILVVVSLLLFIMLIVFFILFLKQKEEKNYTDLSLDFKFNSIVAEMTFEDNRKEIKSTIDYKMVVLSEEVSELKRQVIWSGSDYKGTKLIQKNGDYELEDSKRTSSPYPYVIKFNTKKKRGEVIEFKTETSVIDEKLSMLPMYSFMVKYQIDLLVLHIIAPKGMLKNVQKVVYADSAREVCVEKPTEICGESIRNLVRYTYTIKNPALLYNYFIEWEFTN